MPNQAGTLASTFIFAATALPGCVGLSGSIIDPFGDIPYFDTDFSAFSWNASDGALEFEMTLPALLQPLPVNRDGIAAGTGEYQWGVFIDVDGRPTTGSRTRLFEGADFSVSVSYYHGSNHLDSLYLEQMQRDVWKLQGTGGSVFGDATLVADPAGDRVQMSGTIPGFGDHSRLMPFTTWHDPALGYDVLDVGANCSFFNPDTVHRSGFED